MNIINLTDPVKLQIHKAIEHCDPKLVQIVLGYRYCQLWQYWLIRAIFNYDMLSISKMVKCELPDQIAKAQLDYLEDKTSINIQELIKIQQEQKQDILRKIEDFYGCQRVQALENSDDVRSDRTVQIAGDSIVKKVSGTGMQHYQELNVNCTVQDSITASVNANFIEECHLIVEETIKECEKEVTKAATVSELKNNITLRRKTLLDKESFLNSRIAVVQTEIIHKLQDKKFLEKEFVKKEFAKLLDYYFNSTTFACNVDNPLHQYTQSSDLVKEAKSHFVNRSVSYGFGEYIHHATEKYKKEKNEDRKEDFLNIIRVLATNGAHSESLTVHFDTPELEELALQSIFTISRKVYNVLFDFDESDMSKFLSRIIGMDGQFADPLSGNFETLKCSGTPFIRTMLGNLRCVGDKLQETRKKGKANRDSGLFKSIYYIVQDFMYEITLRESYTPNTTFQHERVCKILYEALELTYLSLASGDDKVLIDYATEIGKKIDKEINTDAREVYIILHAIYKEHKCAKNRDDEARRWHWIWNKFYDIVKFLPKGSNGNDNILLEKTIGTLRVGLYAAKLASDAFDEYEKEKYTHHFRNIKIRTLPGNCLINWLGATYESVRTATSMELERERLATQQAEYEARQARELLHQQEEKLNVYELERRIGKIDLLGPTCANVDTSKIKKSGEIEESSKEVEDKEEPADRNIQPISKFHRLELENATVKLFWKILRTFKFDEGLEDAIGDKQDDIVALVIDNVIMTNSTLENVIANTILDIADKLQ